MGVWRSRDFAVRLGGEAAWRPRGSAEREGVVVCSWRDKRPGLLPPECAAQS